MSLKPHRVLQADRGDDAVRLAFSVRLDLAITDDRLDSPGRKSFLGWFREYPGYSDVPVLMLAALPDTAAGANDFLLRWPVDLREVETRARMLLGESVEGAALFGPFRLDDASLGVVGPAKAVPLTATEFRILHLLTSTNGEPLAVPVILQALPHGGTGDAVRVHLSNLRRKLAEAAGGGGPYVVREGDGYRLRA